MRPSNYDLQAQAAGHSFAAQDLDAIADSEIEFE